MKELESKNKEYANKYMQLVNECSHATDKNNLLSKLINCLTSMLGANGEHAQELPSPEITSLTLPYNNDSMKAARKLLLDSLKSLKFITPGPFSQSKQITNIPIPLPIQSAPIEKQIDNPPISPSEIILEKNDEHILEDNEKSDDSLIYQLN